MRHAPIKVHTRRMLWRLSHSVYYNSFGNGELKPATRTFYLQISLTTHNSLKSRSAKLKSIDSAWFTLLKNFPVVKTRKKLFLKQQKSFFLISMMQK